MTEPEAKDIIRYVYEQFPDDPRGVVKALKAVCRADPSLVRTYAFSQWCAENSSLVRDMIQEREDHT